MDGMVINNLSTQATTECSLLQQELLKSYVEAEKQKGITESLMKRLAEKKIDVISDMYGNIHVTHDNFGGCSCDFEIDVLCDEIVLTLTYYVYKIPLDGLSKHDRIVAKRYNEFVYSYNAAKNLSSDFKTFHPRGGLTGSCCWSFSIDDILESDFLTKGICVSSKSDSPFHIFLK